jgi:two-component system response regulator FixJ
VSETIIIVDDDSAVRDSLRAFLEATGYSVQDFGTPQGVLEAKSLRSAACLIADIRMPGMDGLTLQEQLADRQMLLPVIFITGHGDVPLAVRAMKAGAVDFVEKPFDAEMLLASIRKAVVLTAQSRDETAIVEAAKECVARLTPREREVLQHLVAGRPNKVIAHKMSISPRTVEIHRAHIMEKLKTRSFSELVRTALSAGVEAGV